MLKPDDTFGDYTVVKLLGKGGIGAVQKALDALFPGRKERLARGAEHADRVAT